ncbi:MAG: hypothetical protein ChlgKO_08530 [Chlamydiales bacterium]
MAKRIRFVSSLSNLGYIVGCIILYLIALLIITSSCVSIFRDVFSSDFSVYSILDEVGLIVFAIAVIDVGKYLMMEEVISRNREQKDPQEMRRTLTKLAVIIATALSLEGLVLTIEVAKTNIQNIPYPVAVLLTATLFIVGLGVYQKLNASSESHRQ